MKTKITVKIKSRDEILDTLINIDVMGDSTYGMLTSNLKLGQLEIPDWLWTLCGRTIDVKDTSMDTHQYDYNFFDFPEPNAERISVPVIYFMTDWLDEVVDDVE